MALDKISRKKTNYLHLGTCKLCKAEKNLKNSHIIPEFIYNSLYDNNHRFELLSTTKVTTKMLQKGIREYLLCERCETKLSKYERYTSLLLYGKTKVEHKRVGGLIYLSGIDYKQLRLFGLSVLWRSSISSNPMFEQVKLGPHEEILRSMILNENPGASNEYPFMLALIVCQNEVQTDLIVQPTWTKIEGRYGYKFVFGGLVWMFVVSCDQTQSIVSQVVVSEMGELTIPISNLKDISFVVNLVQSLTSSTHKK